jgi:CheY-like chemotaxis protein/CHASE3 domain sensor protein
MENSQSRPISSVESSSRTIRRWLPTGPAIGFVVALVAVVASAMVSYGMLRETNLAGMTASHALEAQRGVRVLLSTLQDAETGQRGYLLTGDEKYREPYDRAKIEFPANIGSLRQLMTKSTDATARVDRILQLGNAKFSELQETIDHRQSGDAAGALEIVKTNRGKNIMDDIRAESTEILRAEDITFTQSQQNWQHSSNLALLMTLGSAAILFFLIAYAGAMISRDYRAREIQMWIRNGQGGLATKLQGDKRLDTLSEGALVYLCEYLEAQVGAFYIAQSDGTFRRYAGYAIPTDLRDDILRPGDGLVGQAAKTNRVLRVSDVPDGYVAAGSSVGQANPTQLLIAPASVDGVVQAVVELGFFGKRAGEYDELLNRASEQIGVALRSAKDRSRLEELLEETQQQSEELQTQQEELRVSNEELEEQSRALKESAARLESQQTELEQINSQLEEQTQMLEAQRDDLTKAQHTLMQKATDLERVSEYKSEFLANMSHELRTPLNSTLILAKLLADNKTGNLNAEQVKYAQTISSAGTDLLALINDILDLAKIEAGKVEIAPEPVQLTRVVEALTKTFAPMAQQGGLAFSASIVPGTVESIETDPRRLAQIARNLLSNAIKFTPKGKVSLQITSVGEVMSFIVTDSGIGIAAEQQNVIFEAFRQADGSTHRKFGGTGLGLSISRDLARILGGDIHVKSAPGEGSVFTLVLPLVYKARTPSEMAALPLERPATRRNSSSNFEVPAPVSISMDVEDDREHLEQGSRLILVIEDDVRFAEILRDLAHEMAFQCVIAHTAKNGLDAAIKFRPSAILLDINLPDQSGLVVLDQLKRNPAVRHVPVHVVSIADYSREALERGAFGYALKPVKREELVGAMKKLDAKLTQNMRRILLIEDDAQQRANVRQLLGGSDIEIVEVSTAAQAIDQLGASTFDCVILDLSLPDTSGMELLERMSENEDMSFPPVIIYTGQSLTIEEEQSLRRFSRSIILKGARSPERLLDEVMLFLHRVESNLPPESQRLLKAARDRDAAFEGRRILVVEDDVRNIFALSSVLEPMGAKIEIARNGNEAIQALERAPVRGEGSIDLVLMDIMMPEMDGFTAMREIRKRSEWAKLPIIALTAKAMKDDQEKCLAAGANDYIAKPLDVEKLLSLVRVWMRK